MEPNQAKQPMCESLEQLQELPTIRERAAGARAGGKRHLNVDDLVFTMVSTWAAGVGKEQVSAHTNGSNAQTVRAT